MSSEKEKLYAKAYREKNKKSIKLKMQKYTSTPEYKEKRRLYHKKYFTEEIRAKYRATRNKWIKTNLDRKKATNEKSRLKMSVFHRDFVNFVKTYMRCKNCGESNCYALEFHHINPKEKKYNVGKMYHNNGMKKIKDEIKKCIVLCCNCHRKIHSVTEDKKQARNNKVKFVISQKKIGCCSSCGYKDCWQALDYHHLKDKIVNIRVMTAFSKYSMEDLIEELDKCVLLCVNCHKILHNTPT